MNAIEKKLQRLAISNDFYGFIGTLERSDIFITLRYKTTISRYGEEVVTVSGANVTENKAQYSKKGYFFDMKNQVLGCYLG